MGDPERLTPQTHAHPLPEETAGAAPDAGTPPSDVPARAAIEQIEPLPALLERLVGDIQSGALLEAWAALPLVRRLHLRLALRQLEEAFDSLDPLGTSEVTYEFSSDPYDPYGTAELAALRASFDLPPGDTPAAAQIEIWTRLTRWGIIPDPSRFAPDSPARDIAEQHQALHVSLASQVDRLRAQEKLNPDAL